MTASFFRRTVLYVTVIACACAGAAMAQTPQRMSPQEFSRLTADLSEPGGSFRYDNWISNELSYLNVLDPLEQNAVRGGVYIGVGPNQNFTYIAALKPALAFIVDIRRQNMLQHLIWKIAFERSPTRAAFFSFLFSKPLDPGVGPTEKAGISAIVEYFSMIPSDTLLYDKNFAVILAALKDTYRFPLSENDLRTLRFVYRTFFTDNLNMTYSGNRYHWFPTYARFLTLTDAGGVRRNAFNSREEYLFLREMHRENRIIPVVGNFGGGKALKKIARYLEQRRLTLTAFYVSNVEQYLMRDPVLWRNWAENVRSLPRDSASVIIRWTYYRGYYSGETRLQYVSAFLKNYDAGRYGSYRDLIYLDYIKQEQNP